VETHAKELSEHAAVYINSDGNGRGFVELGGSHTLEHSPMRTARDVNDPERKISSQDRFQGGEWRREGKEAVRRAISEIFPLGFRFRLYRRS